MKKIFIYFVLVSTFLTFQNLQASTIEDAVINDERSAKNIVRDKYRHPIETLKFFQIKSNMTVIELSPGSGWYTEILSKYLYEEGKLIAAAYNPSVSDYAKRSREAYEKKLKSKISYNKVEVVDLFSKLSDDATIDAVLTFRNIHNWIDEDTKNLRKIFEQSYSALKPGGIFGVVEHRAKPETSLEDMRKSGYVTEELTINLAKEVGFILSAKSNINANIKDTKDHPAGVWSLPPTLYLKDKNREKFIEIGETDRMTLLFRKPL
ncbi:methyltransferase domain-containing protein [Rhodobiaceae bacterium]|nr:methyltransferase domain-containing protein [Rhodobiaceae bacterium]|tara:strand:+ start:22 stop:813 length:792 start_codon:yes stop_codon:yes gene_type:complete